MLDMSGSTINFRQQLKLASQRFLDALAPDDRVAVIQFDTEVKSLTGFTVDRQKTAYAIEIANGAGETHFYEALKYALKELEKEGKRRKAIVVLDGWIGHASAQRRSRDVYQKRKLTKKRLPRSSRTRVRI